MLRIKKGWETILAGHVICSDCGQACQRTGTTQRYCPACSDARAKARGLKWAKAHPPSSERTARYGAGKRSRLKEYGAMLSESGRVPLSSVFADESGMAWVRKLAIPFSYTLSKNHGARVGSGGHVYLRKETKAARSALAVAVRRAVDGVRVVQAKLWIDLIVHKPDHRGDAVNVLDHVVDGIRDALPIDDRWFSIRRVDWVIVKDRPEILIGIGQEATEDHRACSYCGRVLPLASSFQRNRGMPGGYGRGCKDCCNGSSRKRRRE